MRFPQCHDGHYLSGRHAEHLGDYGMALKEKARDVSRAFARYGRHWFPKPFCMIAQSRVYKVKETDAAVLQH